MPYSAQEYWSALHRRGGLSAVGQAALPNEINGWLYRILTRNFRVFLRRHDLLDPPPSSVFDVGTGIGFWVEFWRSLGVSRIDGCDLIPDAVGLLTKRYGQTGRFVAADITEAASLPDDRYPLVQVMNVLLHVTDDASFVTALANVAGLVQPGGHLVLTEPILRNEAYLQPHDPDNYSRARPLAAYRDPLAAAGLELVDVRAATILANNPVEAGTPQAYQRYLRSWRFVSRQTKDRPRSARWVGPIVSTADRLAMRTGAAPSSKFALFRRPL